MQRSVWVLFAAAGVLVALAAGSPAGAAPPVTNGLQAQFVADDVVPTGGGTVDTWIERSAGVLTASQASAGRQPELVAGALNGHDVVRFDGVDDGLSLSSNLFSTTSFPKTVFVVVRSSDVNGHVVGTGSSSNGFLPSYGNAVIVLANNYTYKANSNSNGLEMSAADPNVDGAWEVVVATLEASGSRLETRCAIAEASDGLTPFNYSTATLGSSGSGVDPLDGEIAELLVYDRALDAAEVASVRSDLAVTYGIVIPARSDVDGDGIVDACDDGGVYLAAPDVSVTLLDPPALTSGVIENVIDAADALASDVHNGSTHVYYAGPAIELEIDLGTDYDLDLFHFWNYTANNFDVDAVSASFRDSGGTEVATLDFVPELGQTPIFGQDFALTDAVAVRTVRVLLTGTNNQVDFQNIGLTGRPSALGDVPALGGVATAILSLSLAASAFAVRRGRRRR